MNPFTNNLPHLDLHGCERTVARALLKEFIDDYIKIDSKVLVVVHGKGSGIVRNIVHEYLKIDKRVKSYNIDGYNDGQTIIYLK